MTHHSKILHFLSISYIILSCRNPFTNVFKLSLEYQSENDDVHLVDFIIDRVTNTSFIFTTIEVTIHAKYVMMKLSQLSVCSSPNLQYMITCFFSLFRFVQSEINHDF